MLTRNGSPLFLSEYFIPWGKLVNGQASFQTGAAVLQAISDGVSEFQDGVSSSFLQMVATDGYGVELGHVLVTSESK